MNRSRQYAKFQERLHAFALAVCVTLFALPASANIHIPNDPLTTGARVPPNILFIMDDSGSMEWRYMYNPAISSVQGGGITSNRTGDNVSRDNSYDSTSTSDSALYDQNYVTNTIYYNPNINYSPWIDSEGAPVSGGDSFTAAYSNSRYITHSTAGTSSGTTNLSNNTHTFYVPKPDATDLSDATQYYRYQIRSGSNGRIVRSERLQGNGSNNGVSNAGCATNNSGWGWRNCQYALPAPSLRGTEAEEKRNFAIWYSFHRTRTKAAKAGASVAFDQIGTDVRVGFRTIHGRNGSSTNQNNPTQSRPIPVNYNDGLFANPNGVDGTNNNRRRWFDRLFSAQSSGGTPLRSALNNAGVYYSSREAHGPYGPQSGSEQLACRQNFAILTTDGFWNSDSGFSSGGNQDGSDGSAILSPTGQAYTYTAEAPYSDTRSNTLADVAMRYWKNDLTDLDNIVPTSSANPAFWQHMVTFGISIGLRGNTGFSSVEDVPANFSNWPNPNDHEDADRIDDLLHAALNSRGSFLSAANPEEFSKGLQAALAAIVERTGSFSNVSANSTSLDIDSRIFQASYVSGVWTGELTAKAVSSSGVASTPLWRASTGIDAAARRVFTSSGAFPANITDYQREALERSGASNYPVSGEQNANYIVGDQSRELNQGGNLRNRNSLLGDIVHSSPAFVPDTNTLYVGANDGMLHAFNAASGEELFAFIPSGISWENLGLLSRPDYSHRYFVDGPVVVSSRGQNGNRNILVGALGRGGKGLFALDVTTPASFTSSDVLWQEYETDGDNMGHVLGAPIIAKVVDDDGGDRPAVIVANGINSSNNRAVLLVYDLMDGELLAEIDTLAGSDDSPNGLSGAVGWDANADGVVDTVYAGDMLGNVWKFDLSGGASDWRVANGGVPMFIAEDADGNRQPISGRLTVGLHPANFATWVFFGTGRFMTVDDVSDRSVQSLYGIVDDGVVTRTSLVKRQTELAGTVNGRPVRSFEASTPLPRTHPVSGLPVKGWYIDLLEPPAQTALGERIVSEVQVINRVLVAASIIPMNDACQSDGRGYLNALDAFTGTSLSTGSFFDIDGDGDFSDEVVTDDDDPDNTLPVGSIDLGVGMPTLPNLLRELAAVGGSTGETGTVETMDARFTGRVSWREEVEE